MALKTIELFIPEGKTTILLGQSGSGKSTLIRIINGLIQPDKGGTVFFEGIPVTPQNALELRHKMGYVIQALSTLNSLSKCRLDGRLFRLASRTH